MSTNLLDGVCKARLVSGERHLMNQRHVRTVQLADHVQQDVSASCVTDRQTDRRTDTRHTVTYMLQHTHTHTHTHQVSWYQKGKSNLDFTEARGSDISWAICKSAPSSREITMPAPHHSVFTGRMPFLSPSQQHQSTEGKSNIMTGTCAFILRPSIDLLSTPFKRQLHSTTYNDYEYSQFLFQRSGFPHSSLCAYNTANWLTITKYGP